MATGSITEQLDTGNRGVPGLYSPTTGSTLVIPAAGTVSTDSNNGSQPYAPAQVEIFSGTTQFTKGQKTGANSFPVVFASDQTVSLTAQIAGTTTGAVASGTAADTPIKASSGFLVSVLVTTTNSNTMLIYDNATTGSGRVIGVIPANSPVGENYFFYMPAANGITVKGSATNPGVTVNYA